MKYYRLETSKRFYSSKSSYAYLSVNKTNNVPDDYKGPEEKNLIFKCPYCGYERINRFFPEKHIAVFNKDNVGDFSLGVYGYGQIAFSQKVLDLIVRYNLKGIVEVKKYNFMETSKTHQPIMSTIGAYYEAKIQHETLLWKYIDKIKECKVVERAQDVDCGKCFGPQMFLSIPKDAKIYLQGLNQVASDIFSTIDNAGHVFFSERFIEACKKENITNLLDKVVEVYDISDLNI